MTLIQDPHIQIGLLSAQEFGQRLLAQRLRQPGLEPPRLLAVIADPAVPPVAALAPASPALVVGVDPAGILPRTWAGACDILLTTAPDPPQPWIHVAREGWQQLLTTLAARLCARPLAASVLLQVLRMGEHLSFTASLLVESLGYSTLLAGAEFAAWRRDHPARPERLEKPGCVTVERLGHLLRVELVRPQSRNALSQSMRSELAVALQIAAADPSITRVTLFGAGPAFCAGGDLDEFGSAPDAATAHAVRMSLSTCAVLDSIRDRVHVDVHGACIGAGIEIAACAASVRVRPDAFFQLPELEMGLIPGAGGTASIARRVGRHRATFLMLTGMCIDSSQALRWGLIDQVTNAPE